MYKPKHFKLVELVSKSDYDSLGEKCWELLDERALITLDALREDLGRPITINTWKSGGQFNWRGYRSRAYYKSDSAYITSRSQHKFGRAFDFDVKGMSAEDVRQYIYKNKSKFPYISFIETEVNWVHIDTRNCRAITTWSPNSGGTGIK